ncbi:class I adenylate-forming enzyme family protein [Dichotomicrobium thermohalophilum]|uniref:Acyl-CoA synthetase (AMP-forming)/AMP-acid ligase II n=1 Tax=Dichotomicrobium thermohalophilum TaxID=933063 RepID=A0A397Q1E4_9HYPH|nr:class I adenylate-forming enzyme family protein [Dichotomicrobium thermohalophilum]RIA55330.1 acyl-CoA synthetase (AMP-forming)/AMP-acid ligase II [Dichotomicrobium thermohalophilum]
MSIDPSAPVPERFNMARYCLAAAGETPDKPALIVAADACGTPSEVWSYAALEDAILRMAGGFRTAGLAPGDRLLIRLENTSAYALTFFGAIAAGVVPVPASDQLSAREAGFLLADSGAAAIALSPALPVEPVPEDVRVFAPEDIAALRNSPRADYAGTRADDPAFLIYTSGTTAQPKGVLHAQRAAWGRRPMYQGWYGIGPDDRVMHAGGFNWTYTLGTGLTDPWANGATAIIYTGEKDPEVWPKLIAAYEATIFAAVPSLYRRILKYAGAGPDTMPSLRHGLCAGEALPEAVAREWFERTGTVLYEALGQSEISTFISSSPSVPPKPERVGKPQPGRRVTILPQDGGDEPLPAGESGLIAVHCSDPGLMLGYWQRPEEDAAATRGDWFITGDLGMLDEDGYIAHQGRADELMNAMGYRVSPVEVESVLAEHPGVAEAAVAQVEARPGVEIIAAFIVRGPGDAVSAEALDAYAEERLARYKRPREYIFIDALPRTPNGKLRRAALAAMRASHTA